jgi:hypothetical protein
VTFVHAQRLLHRAERFGRSGFRAAPTMLAAGMAKKIDDRLGRRINAHGDAPDDVRLDACLQRVRPKADDFDRRHLGSK